METYENEFTNGEIKVTYDPKICIHAEKCANGLSDVFLTDIIPWIDLDGAESKKIIAQVKKCPSGALQYSILKQKVAI